MINKSQVGDWKIILALILITACVVRYMCFAGGIRGSDAFAYAQYAHDIASGQYDLGAVRSFYGFRYTVLLPTAASYIVFGVSDFASGFFPFLFSILNIFMVFKIAERMFNRAIALIAAVLLAIYPLDITSVSVLGPDSFVPFLSAAALFVFIKAEENTTSKFSKIVLPASIGILIAFAYMARVTSIFLFFAFILYQIFHKKYVAAGWITIGLLFPLLGEALFFYARTGDLFFEIHRISSPNIVAVIKNDYDSGLLFYPVRMLGFNTEGMALYGFTWWLVLGGLLAAWIKKEKSILLLVVCVIIPFYGFEFGFQSLREGVLITKNGPYLSLITAPAMVIGAYCLYQTVNLLRIDPRGGKLILIGVLTILTFMNLYGAYRMYLIQKNDSAPYIAVADYLRKNPGSIVYTHHYRWPMFLRYFLRYDPAYEFRDLEKTNEDGMKTVSDAYVVLSRRYLEADVRGRSIPAAYYVKYAASPPNRWKKVMSLSGTPSYNSVDLYYIGSYRGAPGKHTSAGIPP